MDSARSRQLPIETNVSRLETFHTSSVTLTEVPFQSDRCDGVSYSIGIKKDCNLESEKGTIRDSEARDLPL